MNILRKVKGFDVVWGGSFLPGLGFYALQERAIFLDLTYGLFQYIVVNSLPAEISFCLLHTSPIWTSILMCLHACLCTRKCVCMYVTGKIVLPSGLSPANKQSWRVT